jgi:hypothetical protein
VVAVRMSALVGAAISQSTFISCNKYRQINYQLPNEVISHSMTLPRALALCVVSPKTKLDGREIDRSKPQFASSHAMILSSRLPSPSGGIPILTPTGNRRSASRAACLPPKATDWHGAASCAALMERPGESRWGVDNAPGLSRSRRSRPVISMFPSSVNCLRRTFRSAMISSRVRCKL